MKENDIRPIAHRSAQQKAIDWDIEWLLARKDRWAPTDCPACAGGTHTFEFSKKGFSYHRCGACGTLFTTPRPTEEILKEFYAISRNYDFFNQHIFPASENNRLEKIFRPRAALVAQVCRAHNIHRGDMLEIGAGFGTFIRGMREIDLFDKIVAVQTGPLADRCREAGADTVITDLMDESTTDDRFDVVTCFEVIEHTFDPHAFLRLIKERLRPGGLLVMSCPNVAGFDIVELGSHSDSIDHEHLNYFTLQSLRILLERSGLLHLTHSTPGMLDVELVRNKWLVQQELAKDPFLENLILHADDGAREAFQQFLAGNCLSSHLIMVAQRPKVRQS